MFNRRGVALLTGIALALTGAVGLAAPVVAAESTLVAAPSGLAVANLGGDPVFSWSAVDGAAAYSIQIATDDSFSSGNIIARASTFGRSWVPTSTLDVAVPRTLFWRVAAFGDSINESSLGSYSAVATLDRPAAAAPTPSAPVSGSVITYPTPVTFSWATVQGAVSYTLSYSSDPSFPTATTTTVPAVVGTSYSPSASLGRGTDPDDEAGARWYWRVRANFSTATGPTSGPYAPTSFFNVNWPRAASAPELISPADGATTYSDLRFTWKPVPGASGYSIVIGAAKDSHGDVITVKDSASTTSTTYVPKIQFSDTNYWWQVRARDAAGNLGARSEAQGFVKAWGAQSGESVATTSFVLGTPVTMAGSNSSAAPTEIPLDQFELSWEPLPRATAYEVELREVGGSLATLTCRTASTSATIIGRIDSAQGDDKSLLAGDAPCLWTSNAVQRVQPGKKYLWHVRALDYPAGSQASYSTTNDETLVSPWSDQFTVNRRFITVTDPSPVATDQVQPDLDAWAAESATHLGKPAPRLTWQPVQGVNAYRVTIARNLGMNSVVRTFYTPSAVLRVDGVFADVDAGSYYWQVQGINMDEQWQNYTESVLLSPSDPLVWQKQSTPSDFTGVEPTTVSSDGSLLLRWRPQSLSAPDDGGSRGYKVTIYKGLTSTTPMGSTTAEFPYYLAKDPTTGVALAPGKYRFSVAPLDALGVAGRASVLQGFTIAAPAPTGLSAQVDGTTVTLGWHSDAPVKRFSGELWPEGNDNLAIPLSPEVLRQSTATVDSLAPGVYAWRVRSFDDADNATDPSATGTFTVAKATVGLSTPDDSVLTTANRVLDWSPVPGASRYVVRIATSPGTLPAATPFETVATAFSPTVPLPFGTQYYWQVTAVPERLGGTTAVGTSAVRAFTASTTPAAPYFGTVRSVGTSVELVWADLSGPSRGAVAAPAYAVRYRVVDPTGAPTEWSTPTALGSGVTAYTVGGLLKATVYEFEIRAANSEGVGPWSAPQRVQTATYPGAVTYFQVTPSLGGLTAAWSLPYDQGGDPVTSYVVQYRAAGAASWVTKTTVAPTIALTGLLRGASYEVKVAARNSVGTGDYAVATKATLTTPSAPRSLALKRGDMIATATWSAPASSGGAIVTGYTLQYRSYSTSLKKWSAWKRGPQASYSPRTAVVASLTNGVSYEVQVRAESTVGPGPWSAAVAVKPAGRPLDPKRVTATAYTGKIKVAWTTASANGSKLSGYKVQVSKNMSTWTTVKSASVSARSYTWTGPKKGTTYYVRVRSTSDTGLSAGAVVTSVVAK
ncbi:fibronectin type III domain-containing protein [Cellulomonas edaphi]|uniref:Fibronectin type III domain-containing protein n=1 Tax=Cellulomonas edaphi TaxID=3053468 RepID=A0ABT7S6T7_9CELL|nr:fibronectin type III domain-containing protein [Cellulomons edaphi]MDM7831219.1 fibronectin type III domain-containing protein [Cellulomons edaphi]